MNSTDEAERTWLMPTRLWGLRDIAGYGERFYRPGDRRVVLNFALAEGLSFEAGKIKGFFDPEVFAVKLTPLNPTRRGAAAGMRTVLRGGNGRPAIEAVCRELSAAGFDVVISVGDAREDLIGSNCGQAVLQLAGA